MHLLLKINQKELQHLEPLKIALLNPYPDADEIQLGKILGAFKNLEKDIVRRKYFKQSA